MKTLGRRLLLLAILITPIGEAWAQQGGLPGFSSTPGPGGSTTWTMPLQTLILLTALTFIPAMLLLMTSFTRIIIVLSLLRSALGLQGSPPNQVLIGLSLFMTFFIMGPTFDKIHQEAYVPLQKDEITFQEALDRAQVPMKSFMLKQVRRDDLALFTHLARLDPKQVTAENLPLRVIVPAFAISELKTAFQIGFMIFLPFLVVDMVVSSVLMSMGMMMLSPVLISLPFKLMLFVLADGWNLLVSSLVSSFVT